MKRMIVLAIACLFFYIGCGHVQNIEEGNYVPPTVKYQPKIFYPAHAQENSITGITKLMLYIDKDGQVKKVDLVKSSGNQVLDSAAENYCWNIVFNPALGNGRPIGSRLNWEIKFNMSNKNQLAFQYIYDMQSYFNEINGSLPSERKRIQKLILIRDSEFVHNMTDILNFNNTIEQVLLSTTSAEWKKDWDVYPLSFLLYYDFMQRFPDYEDLAAVKTQMLNALKHDIRFIKKTPGLDSDRQKSREMLLWKLEKFAKEKFPGIAPGELDGSLEINS